MKRLLFCLMLPVAAACAVEQDPTIDAPDVDPDEAETVESTATWLASVEVDDGTVEFALGEDGVVFVSESMVAEAGSELDDLVGTGATPLEMFLSLSDAEPPAELVAHHQDYGYLTGAPDEPRDPAALSAAGALPWGFVDTNLATSCTYANDKAWFDNNWQSWGWSWHWYWYSSGSGGKYTASVNDEFFYTHLCNYSRGPGVVYHCAQGAENGNVWCQDVDTGHRSTIFAYGTATDWRGLQTGWYANTGNYKLGATSP